MNKFKKGDVVFKDGEKWIVEMVICARIYIRNKSGKLIIPRSDEVKPVLRLNLNDH